MYRKRLKEYVEEDKIYQDYKNGKEPAHNDGCTDFDWFCIKHCEDIDNLLNENEFLKLSNPEQNIEHFRIIKENKRKIDNLRKENKELHNKIDKAIRMLEINIEIAKQQPSKNKLEDEFFINKCNGLLKILKDSDVDE